MTVFASKAHRPHVLYRPFFLVLLVLWLAGCQAQPFATPIKVGFLVPLEGERREMGYALLPALLAAAPRDVQGHPVEWVILDTHSDPAIAAQRAGELIADPAVLYIVGPLLLGEAAAVQPIVEAADMAWTPLAPVGETGLRAWSGGIPWWADCWVAQHLTSANTTGVSICATPAVPSDTGTFTEIVGSDPTPETWLVWVVARHTFTQLENASALERGVIHHDAIPYALPPAVEFTY